ncbi:hypothetical protein Rcae01_04282 [Novipirellula caenicola]|uniref:Uncharacterized protein n=1 Tax=Novipirellula caenicola TaxID=1536901 RepID=A0ABP9VUJ3_9BACT
MLQPNVQRDSNVRVSLRQALTRASLKALLDLSQTAFGRGNTQQATSPERSWGEVGRASKGLVRVRADQASDAASE